MPYIKAKDRKKFSDAYHLGAKAKKAGELNYIFSKVFRGYLDTNGANYSAMNDILGACDGATREFYRRIVVPYEEKKKKDNGDIY